MKGKFSVKSIVLTAVAVVLAIILIVGNCVLSVYSLIINRFFVGDTADSSSEETQDALLAADEVVREAAEESIVLLKNDNDFLPIKDLAKVNLFGWGSTDNGLLLTGGGSGGTTITDTVTVNNVTKDRIKVDLTDALKAENIEYNTSLTQAYVDFSNFDADYRSGGSTGANAVESLKNPDASFYTQERMDAAKTFSTTAVVVLTRWGAENGGSQELLSIGKYGNGKFLELTSEERAMFAKLQENNFDVIVLLNVCNNIELGFLDEYSCIKACLHIGIPGQSGLAAVPKILKGEVNPSGRTSDIYPYDYQTNNPVYVNATKTGSDITYQEGIYYGYRWYETADAEGYFKDIENGSLKGYDAVVQFPFGYGLSYTNFKWKADWKGINTLTENGDYEISVTVTNEGSEAGRDVVQLYGHASYTSGGIEKAERVLLDFAKTPVIEPGHSEKVTLKFRAYDLASYDDYDKNGNGHRGYELEAGNYELYVMTDSHTVVDYQPLNLKDGIKYEKDPVSNNDVENRFTGNDAYANCPVDGSTALTTPVEYLSRANKFANMPTKKAGTSNVGDTPNFRHTEYDDKDISNIEYGQDLGMYLVEVGTVDGQDEDGNDNIVSRRRAELSELTGESSLAANEKFVFNKDVLNYLVDYNDEYWDFFLNQMTQEEIKSLIGMGGFMTSAIYSIGKPRCTDKDGPAGFNNNVTNAGRSSEYTLFPSESLLGCSWSKEIGRKIGEAQGKIGSSMGINGWYGPGANLHRSVYNSRNYEYFSEDAVLSGKLSAEIILGAKDNNVYCYMKHFAVSEEGDNPRDVNTWLTEQALRECYLKPFEIAVKDGKANAIMSAFNRVGAVLSGYNYAMLTGVLREEWGFKGSVITDWYTGSGYMESHTLGVLGGNDLWLCGSTAKAANLDLSDPAIAYAARQSAKNILYTYVDTYITATTIKVNPEAFSPLFVALWVVLDVLLVAGIAVCTVFVVLPIVKGRKAGETSDIGSQDTPTET